MAQMKDKKQQLDEWFAVKGKSRVHVTKYNVFADKYLDFGWISLEEVYKMFKLGIELGYEPEENDNEG